MELKYPVKIFSSKLFWSMFRFFILSISMGFGCFILHSVLAFHFQVGETFEKKVKHSLNVFNYSLKFKIQSENAQRVETFKKEKIKII